MTYFSITQSFWNFSTHHGNTTAVLYAKFPYDSTIVMDLRDVATFKFKMSFGRISHVAQCPWDLFKYHKISQNLEAARLEDKNHRIALKYYRRLGVQYCPDTWKFYNNRFYLNANLASGYCKILR